MTAVNDQRGRKPISLETQGGNPNRQRMWEAIRALRTCLDAPTVAERSSVHIETVRSYLQSLEKAGHLNVLTFVQYQEKTYELVNDVGREAPKVTRQGKESKQGLGTEIMWRTLRILGEVDANMLVEHAQAASYPLSLSTANAYLKALKRAGYLRVVRPARATKYPERVALAPGKNTGPQPPMIQRTKQVYDPNINQVVWSQAPEELL